MNIFDKLRGGVLTTTAEETRALAAELAREVPPDRTLALHGNLGVGKTTFVQGFARGLGVTETVTSPTFNIFTLYRSAGRTLVHLDAYRLENGQSVDALMLEDFLISPFWLTVEWPDKIPSWIPVDALHLELSIQAAEAHLVRLRS